jgi:hypothetical protein
MIKLIFLLAQYLWRNRMSVGNEVKHSVIGTVIELVNGHVFTRICAEMKRVQEQYPALPGETKQQHGKRKRDQVIADCNIIFTDLVEPVGEGIIRLLIEMGMMYLKTL